MKFTLTSILIALTATTTTFASPITVDVSVGTPGFTCPNRVDGFCHASNVHSGCTSDGEFYSDAMDVCGQCTCL
ncbi:hypothetical protein QBC40DRAFT_318866 [Triangularia verruculosa]|uniref:Uncharacterized protein n=1 Tax=Triangularia verruculosa TaxID=2587418 RepID=A0AAN6X7X3_9PEZI|nr:hypothetical protein QBC40DRAFT_318866 [Triangularia verruculosa]